MRNVLFGLLILALLLPVAFATSYADHEIKSITQDEKGNWYILDSSDGIIKYDSEWNRGNLSEIKPQTISTSSVERWNQSWWVLSHDNVYRYDLDWNFSGTMYYLGSEPETYSPEIRAENFGNIKGTPETILRSKDQWIVQTRHSVYSFDNRWKLQKKLKTFEADEAIDMARSDSGWLVLGLKDEEEGRVVHEHAKLYKYDSEWNLETKVDLGERDGVRELARSDKGYHLLGDSHVYNYNENLKADSKTKIPYHSSTEFHIQNRSYMLIDDSRVSLKNKLEDSDSQEFHINILNSHEVDGMQLIDGTWYFLTKGGDFIEKEIREDGKIRLSVNKLSDYDSHRANAFTLDNKSLLWVKTPLVLDVYNSSYKRIGRYRTENSEETRDQRNLGITSKGDELFIAQKNIVNVYNKPNLSEYNKEGSFDYPEIKPDGAIPVSEEEKISDIYRDRKGHWWIVNPYDTYSNEDYPINEIEEYSANWTHIQTTSIDPSKPLNRQFQSNNSINVIGTIFDFLISLVV